MKTNNCLILTTSPLSQPVKKPRSGGYAIGSVIITNSPKTNANRSFSSYICPPRRHFPLATRPQNRYIIAMAYKDSLFRSLFGNEKAALELYNALHGTDYSERDAEITINTLGESLFSPQKNDLSFIINGKLVILVEHQSSINENMPFRFLQPIARIFENGIPDRKAVYRKALIKLPRPEFIVLYNGTAPFPDRETLRLSEAYEQVEGFNKNNLELEVQVYNINDGRNAEAANRCGELKGYAYFVHRVRYHEAEEREKGTLPEADITREAVRKAIQDCKDKSLLAGFWDTLKPEEVNMLVTEWDMATALEVEREEGREEERKEILKLLNNGYTLEAIKEELTKPVFSSQAR